MSRRRATGRRTTDNVLGREVSKEALLGGVAEGFAEVRAECDAEWRAWLRRFREAEAWGEPFDEPTPAEKEARNRPRTYS